jgi:hypothetical protein
MTDTLSIHLQEDQILTTSPHDIVYEVVEKGWLMVEENMLKISKVMWMIALLHVLFLVNQRILCLLSRRRYSQGSRYR